MELLILLGLILLNGLFAMSEIALVTSRKTRLAKRAAEGDGASAVALQLAEDPTRFLSSIQIGITSIGLLSGIVSEAVLAAPLAIWMQSLGLPASTADIGSTALVVITVTYLSIVIGELVPKRLGQINPEAIARRVARPMQLLALLVRPFVALLSLSTHGLLRLLRIRQDKGNQVTEEDIHLLLAEGSEAGTIELNQHRMVRNVFLLDDRQLGSLMVPRANIQFLDIQQPAAENLRRLLDSEFSRFPVCDGGLDQVLGVIHAKTLLAQAARGEPLDLVNNLLPGIYIPETLTALALLEEFSRQRMHLAFVIDEYGVIEGIVTRQDVLASVTGEFTSDQADHPKAQIREDGSWLLDATLPLPELKDCLQLRHLPEEDKKRYHTLGGMLLLLLGHIPVTGERIEWESWQLEIIDMDGKRIDKVLANPLDITENNPA